MLESSTDKSPLSVMKRGVSQITDLLRNVRSAGRIKARDSSKKVGELANTTPSSIDDLHKSKSLNFSLPHKLLPSSCLSLSIELLENNNVSIICNGRMCVSKPDKVVETINKAFGMVDTTMFSVTYDDQEEKLTLRGNHR